MRVFESAVRSSRGGGELGEEVTGEPVVESPTPEQVATLADTIQPEYRSLVLTAAYSSLRWGERAGLRQRNVNPALRI